MPIIIITEEDETEIVNKEIEVNQFEENEDKTTKDNQVGQEEKEQEQKYNLRLRENIKHPI